MSETSDQPKVDLDTNWNEAWLPSKLTWWFANRFIRLGKTRQLNEDDSYKLHYSDTMNYNLSRIYKTWCNEKERVARLNLQALQSDLNPYELTEVDEIKLEQQAHTDGILLQKPSYLRAILNAYGFWYLRTAPTMLLEIAAKIGSVLLLKELINFVSESSDTSTVIIKQAAGNGYAYAVGLFLCTVCVLVCHHQQFFLGFRSGMNMRIGSTAILYSKTLSLRATTLASANSDAGQAVNILSSDTWRFEELGPFGNFAWAAPLELGIILYLIYREVGKSMYYGMAVFLAIILMQYLYSPNFARMRSRTSKLTDARLKTVGEVLHGAEIVKMYSWENPLANSVEAIRRLEVKSLAGTMFLKGFNMAMFFSTIVVVTMVVFLVHSVYYELPLASSTVFSVIGYFNLVASPLMSFMPMGIERFMELTVVSKRISNFLSAGESVFNAKTAFTPIFKTDYKNDKHTDITTLDSGANLALTVDDVDNVGDANAATNTDDNKKQIDDTTTIAYTVDGTEIAPGEVIVDSNNIFTWLSSEPDGQSKKEKEELRKQRAKEKAKKSKSKGQGKKKSKSKNSNHEQPDDHAEPSISIAPSISAAHSLILNEEKQHDERQSLTFPNGLTIPNGTFGCVIGYVGSGKSSFMQALLGDMPISQGSQHYFISGKVAYAPQKPWLNPGSIRDNITFGSPYDEQRYRQVLRVCGLERDLTLFETGDHTIIAERGANLSGGQRARVGLARAVYAKADVYLFDDVLSAVDQVVAKDIFDNCFGPNGFLAGKTRLLVTHQLYFLPNCDVIIKLEDGVVSSELNLTRASSNSNSNAISRTASGNVNVNPNASINSPTTSSTSTPVDAIAKFALLPLEHHDDSEIDEINLTTVKTPTPQSQLALPLPLDAGNTLQTVAEDSTMPSLPITPKTGMILSTTSTADTTPLSDTEKAALAQKQNVISDEGRAKGVTSLRTYVTYFTQGQNAFILFILLLLLLAPNTLKIFVDNTLSTWSDKPYAEQQEQKWALQFGILAGVAVILGFFRSILIMRSLLYTAAAAHDSMFKGVLFAPMSFYHRNPSGRILNRFSKDQMVIDELLPFTLFDLLQIATSVLATIAVIAYVAPYVLLSLLVVIPCFLWLRFSYVTCSREVKRLESTTRSKFLVQFNASLSGLPVIRSFGMKSKFERDFSDLVDSNSRVFFSFYYLSRWIGTRLDMSANLLVLVTGIVVVSLRNSVDAGSVGLMLTYVNSLTGVAQWGIRQSGEVENQMTSAERVVEYGQLQREGVHFGEKAYQYDTDIDSNNVNNGDTTQPRIVREDDTGEESIELDTLQTTSTLPITHNTQPETDASMVEYPPTSWPENGHIIVKDVRMRYRDDLPDVIKGLTFTINAREKIGVCGRTGAGKSSLFNIFFRLVPYHQGVVYIDGVDIRRIGLSNLRAHLSIIPQSPVIFSGSLRYNLDPFHEHTDESIFTSLQKCQLMKWYESLSNGLDSILTEGGSNISVGQAQLVCIARALLQSSKVLFIDEATANIDSYTDSVVQKIFQEAFVDRTVLTIAHRLDTILYCDRIIVMDAGVVAEFDTPDNLIQAGGIFAQMYAAQQEEHKELSSEDGQDSPISSPTYDDGGDGDDDGDDGSDSDDSADDEKL